jgi:hypothetical protein
LAERYVPYTRVGRSVFTAAGPANDRIGGSRRCLDASAGPGILPGFLKADVYVSNISREGPGNVDVYSPASKKEEDRASKPIGVRRFDEAIDSADNPFMVYADVYGLWHVVEFAGEKNPAAPFRYRWAFPAKSLSMRQTTFWSSIGRQERFGVCAAVYPTSDCNVFTPSRFDSVPIHAAWNALVLRGF